MDGSVRVVQRPPGETSAFFIDLVVLLCDVPFFHRGEVQAVPGGRRVGRRGRRGSAAGATPADEDARVDPDDAFNVVEMAIGAEDASEPVVEHGAGVDRVASPDPGMGL